MQYDVIANCYRNLAVAIIKQAYSDYRDRYRVYDDKVKVENDFIDFCNRSFLFDYVNINRHEFCRRGIEAVRKLERERNNG